jgi:hypothetical protein
MSLGTMLTVVVAQRHLKLGHHALQIVVLKKWIDDDLVVRPKLLLQYCN